MENRLERLRDEIDLLILEKNPERNHHKLRLYISHMYGVARFCTLLAMKRNLDIELATTCGMLHDIYYMTGGSTAAHALKGANQAKEILQSLNEYSQEEIDTITTAIARHSEKGTIHSPYDELLKDADVMDHCLYNTGFPVSEKETARYQSLLAEFGMDSPC